MGLSSGNEAGAGSGGDGDGAVSKTASSGGAAAGGGVSAAGSAATSGAAGVSGSAVGAASAACGATVAACCTWGSGTGTSSGRSAGVGVSGSQLVNTMRTCLPARPSTSKPVSAWSRLTAAAVSASYAAVVFSGDKRPVRRSASLSRATGSPAVFGNNTCAAGFGSRQTTTASPA